MRHRIIKRGDWFYPQWRSWVTLWRWNGYGLDGDTCFSTLEQAIAMLERVKARDMYTVVWEE